MSQQATFVCLRCGAEHQAEFSPKVVQERTCPKCHSNSVRRVKKKKAAKAKAES
jgi:Zn finger protein HypA/HybF involved in hydrogenase expression